MDAFDAVRSSAALLHEKVVNKGADPLIPASLVEAAIALLDLELHWLEPGDPSLKGRTPSSTIRAVASAVKRQRNPGEGAALIAHELGHACVHSGSSCCSACDIDASRPTDAGPVGVQRVEDYGVRERRELQANVFARSRLPSHTRPAAFRRRRHGGLGQSPRGWGCRRISSANSFSMLSSSPGAYIGGRKTRLPVGSHARESVPGPKADHRGSPFQLQAGPGTGKDADAGQNRAVAAQGRRKSPSAILILTFSNRAAGELAERIASVAKDEWLGFWIGTFHAFGLDLMRRYHERLGPPRPVLFDKSNAIETLQELLPTLPLVHYRNLWEPALVLREIVAAISRAKDELTDPMRYRSLAEDMLRKAGSDEDRVAAEKCLEVAQVYDLYEKALSDHGAVDFGDLIMRPALLWSRTRRCAPRLSCDIATSWLTNTRTSIGRARGSSRPSPATGSGSGSSGSSAIDLPIPRCLVGQHGRFHQGIPERDGRPTRGQLPVHARDCRCRGGDRAATWAPRTGCCRSRWRRIGGRVLVARRFAATRLSTMRGGDRGEHTRFGISGRAPPRPGDPLPEQWEVERHRRQVWRPVVSPCSTSAACSNAMR